MTTAAQNPPDLQEVVLVARGLATAVAPDEGITDVQAALLEAIASALTGFEIDYRCLDALSADDFAAAISHRDEAYRQRLVHHMVLGELVLRPLPIAVAARVAKYAQALGIDDKFVRVARRYAQGAYGLAWIDLARSGFTQHLDQADQGAVQKKLGDGARPFAPPDPDPALAGRWAGYRELP